MPEKTKFTNIDEYIATFPSPVKAVLENVRKTIKSAVPEATEVISYNIPAFKYKNSFIMYFSGYTNHISISFYPTEEAYKAFKNELVPYKKSKSTVQFPLDETIPYELIAAIAKFKASKV